MSCIMAGAPNGEMYGLDGGFFRCCFRIFLSLSGFEMISKGIIRCLLLLWPCEASVLPCGSGDEALSYMEVFCKPPTYWGLGTGIVFLLYAGI